ncbi:hypothetical protein KIN20_011316 [Parelaphostrongylus tenuis]|uniref:SCP domain-containing protein n=1 Tax=Parelaphostrongylus tenuis TaxID=148309 RepID=A0AAD5M984_PARTN|nr:hypothetical protein KIN20_011316 [Parelaphostrongylus tenuis]
MHSTVVCRTSKRRLRIKLAQGRQKNGNGSDVMYFPKASDMSPLVYDCELEKAAHEISKRCHNENNLDFRNVGSNSATYHFRSTINDSDIIKMIDTFFNTSAQSRPLINLTPTENDTPIIPFLQGVPWACPFRPNSYDNSTMQLHHLSLVASMTLVITSIQE